MNDYSGNRIPYIYVLFHESDWERVLPVLEAMEGSGLRFCGIRQQSVRHARKALAILTFLSEPFVQERQDAFFAVKDLGLPLIPILLESVQLPETMQQALYAQNSIMAERYPTPKALAERILTAEVFADPVITPAQKRTSRQILIGLCGCAAVLLLASVLLLRKGLAEPIVEEVVQTSYENPFGFSQEDLENICSVTIIGEHYRFFSEQDLQKGEPVELDRLGRRAKEGETVRWYWQEDNSASVLTNYDLNFLTLFPNVRSVYLANISADGLPDLSTLSHFYQLELQDCQISDIQGISGSVLAKLTCMHCPIADYSPLTSCPRLREVSISQHVYRGADYSNFSPPMLQMLTIDNAPALGANLRLDGLKECPHLSVLQLSGFTASDLNGIAGLKTVDNLYLHQFSNLRNVSALRTLEDLKTLDIWDAGNLYDLSPIGSCTTLKSLTLRGIPASDSKFMDNLVNLNEIGFHIQGTNLNFLRNLKSKNRISLFFSGPIQDYSGLEAITSFSDMHINLNGRSYHELVEPYLANATVYDAFELFDCRDVQLDKMPDLRGPVSIQYGDLENLAGLGNNVQGLRLTNVQTLTSLDGLEVLSHMADITVNGCMRLQDWSAIDGMTVNTMEIGGTPTLPDFSTIQIIERLTLDSIPELTELSCLTGLQNKRIDLFLPGMAESADLSALNCMQGTTLGVPPALEIQAMKLVESRRFREYFTVFPEGEWHNTLRFSLQSLDELDTLPEAILGQVTKLSIAGNTVYDSDICEIRYMWNGSKLAPVIHNRETGAETQVQMGTVTDLSRLQKLTGLHELTLVYQPLKNLDGIQQFASLVGLDVNLCTQLEDISSVFSLDALEWINAHWTKVSSIQGIQNLHRLCDLDVSNTNITDLTPLRQCNFNYAYQHGGFGLAIDCLNLEDLSPLNTVTNYRRLSINVLESNIKAVFETIKGIPIDRMEIDWALHSQDDLEALVKAVPSLRILNFNNNPEITDLTPLLSLPNLQELNLGSEMGKQAQELLNQHPPFKVNYMN